MPLTELNEEIVNGMGAIEGIAHAGNMPKRRDTFSLPAIVVDLAEIEIGTDPGTGELGLTSHWEARVIASERDPESVIWSFTLRAMYWLFNFNWPQINVSRPMLKHAAPDHFTPELQGHRVWLIEWTQEFRIGDNIYEELADVDINRITVHWGDNCSEVVYDESNI